MTGSKAFDQAEPDFGAPLPILALVAFLTAATLELVRSTGPLLEYAFDVSVIATAVTALVTYLAPAVFGLALIGLMRGSNAPTVMLAGVTVLAVARLVAQGLTGTARLAVGLTSIALSITMLTLVVSVAAGRRGGNRAAAAAVALGAAFGVGIQLALGTWDAYWRHNPLGWGVTIALLVGLVGSAVLARRDPEAIPTRQVRRAWVLGPAFGLMLMMLANSAFAASQSEVPLAIAGPIAATGLLGAGVVVALSPRGSATRPSLSYRGATLMMAAAPAAAIAGIFWVSGPAVLALLVAAQVALVSVLVRALDITTIAETDAAHSLVPAARASALVGLGIIVPLLGFHLDYDIPLGFPNELVIVAAALVLGGAMICRQRVESPGARTTSSSSERTVISKPIAALLAPVIVIVLLGSVMVVWRDVTRDPRADPTSATAPLTLVSWNVHYGVSPRASVDLEQIARSIEEHQPSVVTLQEVSRGWVLGAGADMATWLAQRLDMDVFFAPAADRQFGNAILTALPTTNVTRHDLPYGDGPQNRSAISVDVAIPGGPIRVTSAHLQNKDSTPTRLAQIETLLDAELRASPMIIAGDFNAQPGWAEIDLMEDAGLVSAQDVSGDPSAMTDPSINPEKRIDWVFGRGVSFAETLVLDTALSSDHLPLVVTFTAME